jgi:ribosomal protein S27E
MANVDTDKLKQLLYAMIETLDAGDSTDIKSEEIKTAPSINKKQSKKKHGYASGENMFLNMPEKDMHKSDTEIDKLLAPKVLTTRNRKSTEVDVKCRVCGKEQRVSSSLITDGISRYKCNDCSRGAG